MEIVYELEKFSLYIVYLSRSPGTRQCARLLLNYIREKLQVERNMLTVGESMLLLLLHQLSDAERKYRRPI
jgi:hypothetical protein